MKEQVTYQQFIERIIKARGRHGCGNEYHEKHHIIPKCIGGSNDDENMIDLYAREHYIAHQLLAKENPKEKGLQFAWFCISIMRNEYTNKRYRCTPEEYEEAKKAMALAMSKITKGRIVSEETRQKHRKQTTGSGNPMYGKHHSKETIEKIKNNRHALKGKESPMCRAVYCIETNKMYWGATEVENKLKINKNCVRDCCKGRQKTAGGFHWEYVDGNGVHHHTGSKPVKCVETGQIFWGITLVTKLLKIDSGDIIKCCKNKKKTAGGYHWQYVNKE